MRYLTLTLLPLSACLAPQGVMLDSPLAPLVRETLESTHTDLPILVLEDDATLPSGARASCHQDHIVLAREAQDEFDFFVAHELVHWYIDESPYAGLPHFIEEGLADWIACDLMGGLEGRIAQNIEIGTMSVDPRRLAVTGAGWSYLSREERQSLTRAGFDLVRRLGFEKLRVLLRENASPMDYLRAAGVAEGR